MLLTQVLEPPAEYLQEEILNDDRMPPDALYMLQSIRVFGHFEKPVFLKLCKHTEILNVNAGTNLFRIGKIMLFFINMFINLFIGDPDENVYIVQSGRLNVCITGSEGTNTLKIVKPGESVTSLLSFTDVLTVSYFDNIFSIIRIIIEKRRFNAKTKSTLLEGHLTQTLYLLSYISL